MIKNKIIERKSFLPKQYQNLIVNTTKQGTATPIVWYYGGSYNFLRHVCWNIKNLRAKIFKWESDHQHITIFS